MTRRGRRTHVVSTRLDRASRFLARVHGRICAATGGRLGGRLFGGSSSTDADLPTYQVLTDRPLPVALLERTPPGR